MGQRTPLYDQHLALGAKMVDFGGWDMPLHYGSQVEEHHQVRRDCGVFDVSHMTVVDVAGDQASAYLQHLLANDVARLKSPGRALYSAMLNERGGVIDDLIVYLTDWGYRVVVNAGLGKGAPLGTGRFDANRETAMTNFVGALAQTEAAMELFRAAGGGHLVMVSSMSALRTSSGRMPIWARSSSRRGLAEPRTRRGRDTVATGAAIAAPALLEAVIDPTLGQVIGVHFHLNLVAGQNADAVLAHLSCHMCDDLMAVL